QARGRVVDKRTDIFAFGCVLYEMLTSRRAFDGDDVADILGAVLRMEPDWTRFPANVPPRIRELLRLCLEKNVKNRRSDATDVRLDIELALKQPSEAAAPPQAQPPNRSRLSWSLAALFAAAFAATVILWSPWRTAPPAAPLRLSTEVGADVSLASDTLAN